MKNRFKFNKFYKENPEDIPVVPIYISKNATVAELE